MDIDNLRGQESPGDQDGFDYTADDSAIEPPPAIDADERRMHVRAYNYWASLLGERALPSIEDLNPDAIEDFGPHSVLLDFTAGIEDPAVVYLGTALRQECEIEGVIGTIGEVPARSLLSRLTDHYLQIIANAAPIGFEAEFVNQRGADIMYRGILMPFSSDDDTIDFVYGVINWKEMAGRDLSDALALEVEEALRNPAPATARTPLWADGPLGDAAVEIPLEPGAALADWLALARDSATEAQRVDTRGRAALYRAIGLAYDFALAAHDAPGDYAEILTDAGIKVQARSPMTAVVKLIFGTHYDKTRITEYATALDHGWANGMAAGTMTAYLESYAGGLKGLVRDERAVRRAEKPAKPDRQAAARETLKAAPALATRDIDADVDGLSVVVARREADGSLAIVAALPVGDALLPKVLVAARR